MSQSTLPEPKTALPESAPAAPPTPLAGDVLVDSEYDYKPIPVLAPVTLFLGLASLLAFVTAFGIIIAVCGIILGTICIATVARGGSEIGGFKMTLIGLVLSLSCGIFGSVKLAYDYAHEVPPGFARVSFANDISAKEFVYQKGKGTYAIHPEVTALDGKAVFLKGFMYPTRKTENITEFIMAKDNGDCCFGGEPKVTDMIYVRLAKPMKVNFTDRRVSVAGKFKAGAANSAEGLQPVYELQAEYFTVSKTAF